MKEGGFGWTGGATFRRLVLGDWEEDGDILSKLVVQKFFGLREVERSGVERQKGREA